MKKDKELIGVYHAESALLDEVRALKQQGVEDNHIYVITKNEDRLSVLRRQTDADIHTTEESWVDKFKNFFTGEDDGSHVFDRLDLSDAEEQRYRQEVENGGMLLYVDEEELTDPPAMSDQQMGSSINPNKDRAYDEAAFDESASMTMEKDKMKLHEERLEVDKHEVPRGEVSLEKDVVEEDRSVDVPVTREEVHIERRPVTGEEGTNHDMSMTNDEESIRIPVTEERLDVHKKPVVKEEIVIDKKQKQDVETVHDTVKREEAHLEKEGDPEVKGNYTDEEQRRRDSDF